MRVRCSVDRPRAASVRTAGHPVGQPVDPPVTEPLHKLHRQNPVRPAVDARGARSHQGSGPRHWSVEWFRASARAAETTVLGALVSTHTDTDCVPITRGPGGYIRVS